MYLASLDAKAELNARRLAERSRIPDDDPTWLLLHEMQQATRELTRGANAALTNDAFAERLSSTIASSIVNDQRIIATVANGITGIHDTSARAIRSLESEVREVARKRAIAPVSSLFVRARSRPHRRVCGPLGQLQHRLRIRLQHWL